MTENIDAINYKLELQGRNNDEKRDYKNSDDDDDDDDDDGDANCVCSVG
jgi:hypothetical protein